MSYQPDDPMEDLVARIGRTIASDKFKLGRPDSSTVSYTPQNPNAAPITIVFDRNYGYFVSAGEAAVFEIPLSGKRYTTLPSAVDELAAICSAVFDGRFIETVIKKSSVVIGGKGELRLGEGQEPVVDAWRSLKPSHLFGKKVRIHRSYNAY